MRNEMKKTLIVLLAVVTAVFVLGAKAVRAQDWYIINFQGRCVKHSIVETIENYRDFGVPYKAVDDMVENGKAVQVTIIAPNLDGKIMKETYYRGVGRCERAKTNMKLKSQRELNKYK